MQVYCNSSIAGVESQRKGGEKEAKQISPCFVEYFEF